MTVCRLLIPSHREKRDQICEGSGTDGARPGQEVLLKHRDHCSVVGRPILDLGRPHLVCSPRTVAPFGACLSRPLVSLATDSIGHGNRLVLLPKSLPDLHLGEWLNRLSRDARLVPGGWNRPRWFLTRRCGLKSPLLLDGVKKNGGPTVRA